MAKRRSTCTATKVKTRTTLPPECPNAAPQGQIERMRASNDKLIALAARGLT